MSEAKFKKGDAVELNIGGPTMAVNAVYINQGGNICDCQWFSGDKLMTGEFAEECLKPAKAKTNPSIEAEAGLSRRAARRTAARGGS
jgi:uncharacterized protein YodC (DUF2158 family)